jgi:hypothetical protein
MKTEDEIGCRARGRLEETNSLEGFFLTEAFVSDTFRIFSILRNHWKRVSTLRIPGENGIHKAEEVNAVQDVRSPARGCLASQLVTFLSVSRVSWELHLTMKS